MFHKLVKLTAAIFIFVSSPAAFSQALVSSEFLSYTPSFLLGLVPQIATPYNVDFYKITYNTVDVFGEPTVASGAVAIPIQNSVCNSFPMVGYCHGTVLRQFDVPSAENFEALIVKVFAGSGYIAFAPDYLGLGENPGIHPYVHAASQATATIDMIPAVRELLADLELSENGEVFITGYSQGGHAAMAALQYAQDNDLLGDLGIVAGAPCSGPYDMSSSQALTLLSDEPYSNPGYVVYLLKSYEYVYQNIYEELSEVIKAPYDEIVEPYFDGAQNEYDMDVVNALLPGSLSELLEDSVLANFETNLNHPLRLALMDNDNYDWLPTMPLRMFYCDGDEQVAFTNSLAAQEAMLNNGAENVQAINVQPGANHGACVIPAIVNAHQFFSGLSQGCVLGTSSDTPSIHELSFFPNPANTSIQVRIEEPNTSIYIQDLNGKIVMQLNRNQGLQQIDLSKLSSGQYILSTYASGKLGQGKLVVIR